MLPEPADPQNPPQTGWRAVLRIASGIGLLIVGIIGLILPVMPGWVFVIPGLMILADYFPPVKRLLDWAKAKYEAVKPKSS
ncbi:MAG TPA: PGPGW domain-containing protein [Bryobacteraceae bacterium]|nr:PGPGW domain-containing protein [Bryobacteraceae bacterium]